MMLRFILIWCFLEFVYIICNVWILYSLELTGLTVAVGKFRFVVPAMKVVGSVCGTGRPPATAEVIRVGFGLALSLSLNTMLMLCDPRSIEKAFIFMGYGFSGD